ncbi:MAG: DNA polymerase III subunit beta, partial [Methanomicrobiales archaeon HGW-Methanomicrobiales-5]
MKSTRQDILASLKKLKGEVAREYSVKTIGVFGSVARNEQTGTSDIDLLVEFSKPVGFVTFMRLE